MKEIQIEINKDASDIGLAELIASLIRENCAQNESKRRIFSRLRGDVLIIAKDAEVSIHLSFESGKLTISNGNGKNAGFIIEANSDNIINLSNIRLLMGYPFLINREGLGIIRNILNRDIEIRGISANILFGLNLLRIISVN